MITNKENILKTLSALNPWWRTKSISPDFAKPVKRYAYYEAIKMIEHTDIRRTVILTGARRIGKTTIVFQIIENLLERGVDPTRIVYISFDYPVLKFSQFQDILDVYQQEIYQNDDMYYFFDEIQYVDDWNSWLKVLYDFNPNSQAVATGSASPVLADGMTESGVGRWQTIAIPTLSFYEYCEICGIEKPELENTLKPTAIQELSKPEQNLLFERLSGLRRHFNRYLTVGGFPELALSKDETYAQRILREDIVDKVLKRDIPALFNIRNIADLEKIFLYICYHSSDVISYDTIAKELKGVTRATVEKYVKYLESANLIYISNPIDLSGKKVLKIQPKIYVADAAIRNAVLLTEDLISNATEMGVMAETAVYKHVRSFYYNRTSQIGFSRKGGSGKEIDVVVDYQNLRILIEVKYRESYSMGNKELIVSEANSKNRSLLITKDQSDFGPLEINDNIYKIPAYAFLYLLGHAEKNGYEGYI